MILPWDVSVYPLGYPQGQANDLTVAALHPAPQQDISRWSLQEQQVCAAMLYLCLGVSHASMRLVICGRRQVACMLCNQRRVWGVTLSTASFLPTLIVERALTLPCFLLLRSYTGQMPRRCSTKKNCA